METMESMRMKRMLMTLKKALDVSVSTSSSVSLRKCLEKECVEDPELVKQIFDTKQVEEEDLVAQVLQHLRKEMEDHFMQLSMEKQVDEKLFQLEKDIKEYEVLKLKELSKIENQQLAAKCGGNDALRNPEHLIHLEKLRVMEVEKAQLLEAIEKAKEENNMLQEQLKLKTQEATQDIQRVQQMLGQLDQACNFAKDYAICP